MIDPPRPLERTRLVRPRLYRDEVTGQLTPTERDAYLGIATQADDEGYLLWKPTTIAAAIYPYQSPAKRVRDLEARATTLQAAGLLVVLECGACAFLPRAKDDLVISGGTQTRLVQAFHKSHAVVIRSGTDESVSSTSTSTSSSSDSGLSSSLVDVARGEEANPTGRAEPIGRVDLLLGGTKTGRTRVTNEDLPPRLRVVVEPK